MEAGTATRRPIARPEVVLHGLRSQPRGWLRWLTTTDHKKIGILYLFATFLFFILGGVEALIMRLQLSQPNNTLIDPETHLVFDGIKGGSMVRAQYTYCQGVVIGLETELAALTLAIVVGAGSLGNSLNNQFGRIATKLNGTAN